MEDGVGEAEDEAEPETTAPAAADPAAPAAVSSSGMWVSAMRSAVPRTPDVSSEGRALWNACSGESKPVGRGGGSGSRPQTGPPDTPSWSVKGEVIGADARPAQQIPGTVFSEPTPRQSLAWKGCLSTPPEPLPPVPQFLGGGEPGNVLRQAQKDDDPRPASTTWEGGQERRGSISHLTQAPRRSSNTWDSAFSKLKYPG